MTARLGQALENSGPAQTLTTTDLARTPVRDSEQ